jgi:hypothetical protein
MGAMELNKASTQVFGSVGGVVAECEAAVSGTTDSAHVPSVRDPMGGSEHSAITLQQVASASTVMASATSAITENSGNVTAVGDPVGGAELSAITLLQGASASFKFTSATSTATSAARTESNKVVETLNRGHNNEDGMLKLLELAGRAEHHG